MESALLNEKANLVIQIAIQNISYLWNAWESLGSCLLCTPPQKEQSHRRKSVKSWSIPKRDIYMVIKISWTNQILWGTGYTCLLWGDDLDAPTLKVMKESRMEIPFIMMIICSYTLKSSYGIFSRCIFLKKSEINVDISTSVSHFSSHLLPIRQFDASWRSYPAQ